MEDSSRPYLFQLLEREEKSSADRKAEGSGLGHKKSARLERNKVREHGSSGKKKTAKANGTNDSGDFAVQRPPEKVPRSQEQEQKVDSEIKLTEEQSEDDDNMFMRESMGVDLTVDSEALQQFDYDESLDPLDN